MSFLIFATVYATIYTMGRPAKIFDKDLAEQLRQHMAARGLSTADIGLTLGVDKATISRSLKDNSFSRQLRTRVAAHLGSSLPPKASEDLLQEALHLLRKSDKLRLDAERLIAEALSRSIAGK